MTNFEKITTYLKHGIHVGVKNAGGDYRTISPTKDEDGDYRISDLYDTLEAAKQYIGEASGYINLEHVCKDWSNITPFHLDFELYPIGMKDWSNITPFHLDFELYPIGMKVKVLRTGEVREIIRVYRSGYVLHGGISVISHTELMPYFEEEEEEVVEMTLAQIEEKLNIKGLKIIK